MLSELIVAAVQVIHKRPCVEHARAAFSCHYNEKHGLVKNQSV
jgi:hypothetical protein